jgi:hypothetical protein
MDAELRRRNDNPIVRVTQIAPGRAVSFSHSAFLFRT